MKASPFRSAVMPATWVGAKMEEKLNSVTISSVLMKGFGAVSQPKRQPVIAQDLEKLLTIKYLSSSVTLLAKLGARSRS